MVRVMARKHYPGSSTYSSIFAVLLILLIVTVIGYESARGVLREWRDGERPSAAASPVNGGEPSESPGGTVLYENLSDAQADRIIRELFESGEENLREIEKIETVILE